MSEVASRPIFQCLRCRPRISFVTASLQSNRAFRGTTVQHDEVQAQKEPFYKALDPTTVSSPRLERRLVRAGNPPVGSRRRRLALQTSSNIPFEQLPYQCFQEARKVLQEDREEKLQQIEVERGRIARLKATDPALTGGEHAKQSRLKSMQKHLEHLKILADINDPMTKKRFEDGLGDMNRPIYRFLADKKWREYRRMILVQRITQMSVIPDVLPHMDPVADVKLAFGRRGVQPGDFVDSTTSENPGRLNVQVFDRGEKLVTVAVVDSDVPNLEKDGFDYRCHFLAANIPLSPTLTSIRLDKLSGESQILLPWLAPFAQKGSPYHRLSVFILEQKEQAPVNVALAKEKVQRDGFILRAFVDRHRLHPIGVHLFRSQWDDGTAGVMMRAGMEGADIELRRKRVEPLPYKRRNPSTFR